jgi:hypothetical protein
MKKLGILALTLALGVGTAFAASVGVPWFVDNAGLGLGIPHNSSGSSVTGIITLKSNRTDDLVCEIAYYSAEGVFLGPNPPNNTFVIAALSSLAFRPVANDPSSTPGGQENPNSGALVPNRPRNVDTKKNGSCVITWQGASTDIQGQVAYFQTSTDPVSGQRVTYSYSHLLPPGV